jgi:predicted MFS family arabinose efflux permease
LVLINKILNPYKGLSIQIWYLALITLVNRAGAMVIPFLSLYLTKHLEMSLSQVGWIMSAFGLGSAMGTFLGGKLTDRYGFFKIMFSSLFLTGFLFIGLQHLYTFWQFVFGIFTLTFIADIFRPAIWVAMDAYSSEENKTRSVTLIRLAINLGFSAGPAIGGLIIAYYSYTGLFWIDGLTCIIASFLILFLLNEKKEHIEGLKSEIKIATKKLLSPYKDRQYLLFCLGILMMGIAFMQFFGTLPLYYDNVIGMSEKEIGLLLAGNGFLIFLLEMPLVHYLEKKKFKVLSMIIFGGWFFVLSFLVLPISSYILLPILGMLFLSIGEMISFPFSNTFAMTRSNRGKKGDYMALYTLTFSLSFIIGPNLGMHLSKQFGFNFTWFVMAGLMFVGNLFFYQLMRIQKK